MISPEDIERMQDAYRLINERKIKHDLLADDFLLEQNPGIPGTRGTFRGVGGMESSMLELLDGFDTFRFEPLRFDVHGDWVVVPVTFTASARGYEQRIEIVHLWQLREGRAKRMRVLTANADPVEEIRKLSA